CHPSPPVHPVHTPPHPPPPPSPESGTIFGRKFCGELLSLGKGEKAYSIDPTRWAPTPPYFLPRKWHDFWQRILRGISKNCDPVHRPSSTTSSRSSGFRDPLRRQQSSLAGCT